eukprot:m.335733 g.335733  ORF g.335733 m.335733 type:complete len:83 (+) comp17664_c0_seq1:184-432(+)
MKSKPSPTIGRRLKDWWLWYEVTFSFYMLEPWEKILLHVILLLLLAMSAYTTYNYGIPWLCRTTGAVCDLIVVTGGESLIKP